MGKGGQRSAPTLGLEQQQPSHVWRSSYRPLEKDAPALPTKGQIKASIPKECFQRSYIWGMVYLIRDFVIASGCVYLTSQLLSTEIPPLEDIPKLLLWVAGWNIYAFWMGTIMTGPWVVAHECGHGAFSPSQTWNDVVGYIVHQALLVPYFSWQYSHAKHHRRTNHLVDGESHVPSLASENGLGPNQERNTFYAAWHEVMGDTWFAAFQVWTHLCVGWPLYLLGLASTGKQANEGWMLEERGAVADHFRPWSPMFPKKISFKIFLSTLGCVALLGGLFLAGQQVGHLPVFLWYWMPYFWVNAWLVLYTWLQHTDPSIPHYGESEWTWVRGALSTIDRDYGIFDFFHHRIGSTHVVHHLFHEMPHYNALKATHAVKEFLEPKGLYNYDPTPWYIAMWRVARTCHYVEGIEGVQYLQSLENVPRTGEKAKKS